MRTANEQLMHTSELAHDVADLAAVIKYEYEGAALMMIDAETNKKLTDYLAEIQIRADRLLKAIAKQVRSQSTTVPAG